MSAVHRVLVVDDDPLVRTSYRSFLSRQEAFEICAEATHGEEGVAAFAEHQPDLVLMDMQMPVLDGVEATREICRRWPDACVVVMTAFVNDDFVVSALEAGAAGYLQKDVGGQGLLIGLRQALAGEMPLSGSVRRELVQRVVDERPRVQAVEEVGLTPRETELLGWLAQGMANQEIAGHMYVSEGSVKQYLLNIGRKLGARSRTGILIRAIQVQVVDPYNLPSPD